MANTTRWGARPTSGSDSHLARIPGGAQAPLGQFLQEYSIDNVRFLDDFTGDTIDSNYWTTNAGTNATAWAVPTTPGLGGTITCATGTNATASNRQVNLYGPPIYAGDNNVVMEAYLQFSAVTALQFEVGFIDTYTTITTPIPVVADIDTPSFAAGAGDVAVVAMDTSQTLATMALVCLGSGALNAGSKTAMGTLVPTATTYMRIRVALVGNTVTATVDRRGDNASYQVTKTDGIEGGTLVRPFIYVGNPSSTASRTATLDYVKILMDR